MTSALQFPGSKAGDDCQKN